MASLCTQVREPKFIILKLEVIYSYQHGHLHVCKRKMNIVIKENDELE